MSPDLEAGANVEQSAGPLDVEQLPSPVPSLISKTAVGDKGHHVTVVHVAIDKPYSVYTHKEKWLIVCIASCAANFSPFTANIYFPAIPIISRDFHKSVELINLTVTMYMVMQGLSPMFWGTLSDRWGRRPMMFACLLTLSLSCIGLALVPTSAYWLLMLLRCLQATGSASTVALGAGIIGDITTPDERGGFFGLFNLGALVGPTLGPVIGGALAQGLGWSLGLFLFVFLDSCLNSVLIGFSRFLPETLRSIVGDGSISPGWIYTHPISIVDRHRNVEGSNELPPRKPFKNPLLIFLYPEVFVLLLFNGTIYAVMYGVTASLSVIFENVYPYLNQTDIGLCFLAMGGGLLVGSVFSGRFMDAYYRKIRDDLIRQTRTDSEKDIDPRAIEKDPSFPIEKARLHILPWVVFVYTACVIGYGWALESKVTISVPLILQFIIGATALTVLNATQTLLVDMMPSQGSSITACNNIVRCLMGAGMVSIINPMLVALGDGWTYVVLGGLCVLVSPLLYVEIQWGPFWRERRQRAHP
ncbi:MFS general substrate transporter [Russula ochroleuca]|uniref:MFS general substrate transporter n=1 Tax=Russula ochroleuca TaxID=152965 RepID=A0A9P5MYF9_9AGAM|nr:MFS general substrate transporter [Russula ochroleuca]